MSSVKPVASGSQRLVSLDALRGFDMFLLVGMADIARALPELSDHWGFVALSEQFRHPPWQGFTVYDLIFPLFIFIVGVALPFSFAKRLELGQSRWQLFAHILFRTIILTVLGLIYWGTPGGAHPTWGYYSVLYRIGISFFFAAVILLHTRPITQIAWAFGLLTAYELAFQFVPVPHFGAGDFSKTGNLAAYVSGRVAEIWSPKFQYVVSITLIPSVATALFGVLAGHWLRSERRQERKTVGLLLSGAIFVAAALLTPGLVPINKHLWSASFTLLTAGLSLLLLGMTYWIVDVRGWRRSAFFFVVIGMNSIVIYLGDRLINFSKIANVFVGEYLESFGAAGPLVNAVATAVCIWLFLYALYANKAFVRV